MILLIKFYFHKIQKDPLKLYSTPAPVQIENRFWVQTKSKEEEKSSSDSCF